jgi:hypothetical protein
VSREGQAHRQRPPCCSVSILRPLPSKCNADLHLDRLNFCILEKGAVRGVGLILVMLVPISLCTAIPAKTVHSGNPFDRTIGFPLLGSASKESTMSSATASAATHALVISTGAPFLDFCIRLSVSRKDCVVRNFYAFGQKKIFELITDR